MNNWYSISGEGSDVCLASKIRLSRNISSLPFPVRMSDEVRKTVCKKVFACVQNSKLAGEFDLMELDKFNNIQKISLVEKGIISSQMAAQESYGAVLVSKDKSISVMLCEEDHICITVMSGCDNIDEAFRKANELDDIFVKNMHIAFDSRLGFLTSNPMKLGTGMTAAYMLHLPGICEKQMLSTLRNMVSKLGFSIRSVFEKGCFYEISNDISLGITEQSAIENLRAIYQQIAKQEKVCRQDLIDYGNYEDKIFRAMGTLKMARQLSAEEFFSLVSLVRLGIAMNIFDNNEGVSFEKIGEMLYSLGTASIIADTKDDSFTADEANKLRAGYIRKILE